MMNYWIEGLQDRINILEQNKANSSTGTSPFPNSFMDVKKSRNFESEVNSRIGIPKPQNLEIESKENQVQEQLMKIELLEKNLIQNSQYFLQFVEKLTEKLNNFRKDNDRVDENVKNFVQDLECLTNSMLPDLTFRLPLSLPSNGFFFFSFILVIYCSIYSILHILLTSFFLFFLLLPLPLCNCPCFSLFLPTPVPMLPLICFYCPIPHSSFSSIHTIIPVLVLLSP